MYKVNYKIESYEMLNGCVFGNVISRKKYFISYSRLKKFLMKLKSKGARYEAYKIYIGIERKTFYKVWALIIDSDTEKK